MPNNTVEVGTFASGPGNTFVVVDDDGAVHRYRRVTVADAREAYVNGAIGEEELERRVEVALTETFEYLGELPPTPYYGSRGEEVERHSGNPWTAPEELELDDDKWTVPEELELDGTGR